MWGVSGTLNSELRHLEKPRTPWGGANHRRFLLSGNNTDTTFGLLLLNFSLSLTLKPDARIRETVDPASHTAQLWHALACGLLNACYTFRRDSDLTEKNKFIVEKNVTPFCLDCEGHC